MLEIGKSYKTRCGAAVRVLAFDPENDYPFIAEISGTSTTFTVSEHGEYSFSAKCNQLDIIAHADGSPLN